MRAQSQLLRGGMLKVKVTSPWPRRLVILICRPSSPACSSCPSCRYCSLSSSLNIFAKDNKYFCTKIFNIYFLYLNIHWNSWEADGQVNKSQGPNNTKNERHSHSSKGCCPQHGVAGKAENYSLRLDLGREVSRHRTDHLSKCLRQTYLMNIVPPTEIIMLAREAGMDTL